MASAMSPYNNLSRVATDHILTRSSQYVMSFNGNSTSHHYCHMPQSVDDDEWVALNTPIERGSDARFGGVHFFGPPHFGSLEIFMGFFANFGAYGFK